MPTEIIAVGQFNLSFLNTAVCGLVLIFFGVGLGTGIFGGSHNLLLTLLPAVIAAIGILAVLLIARRLSTYAQLQRAKHPKVARSMGTLSEAVTKTAGLLRQRDWRTVLGALTYVGGDLLILWLACWLSTPTRLPASPWWRWRT